MSTCDFCNSIPDEVRIHLKDIVQLDFCNISSGTLELQEQARLAILNSDAFLSKLLVLAKKRSVNDKKVPPGSNAVERNVLDKRFVLSLLCINRGRLIEEGAAEGGGAADPEESLECYREALLWFPRSIEAAYYFGRLYKIERAFSPSDLTVVGEAWSKALTSAATLGEATHHNHTSRPACDSCVAMLSGSLGAAAIRREREALAKTREALILHLCQSSRLEEARVLLAEDRYTYKLSQEIFHYYEPRICARSQCACLSQQPSGGVDTEASPHTSITTTTAAAVSGGRVCSNAMGVDHVLAPALLQRMQHVFRPDSPFWAEHKYDFYSNASRSVGYFSYLYPFRTRLSPRNLIEQVIDQIYAVVASKFPNVAENATIAEWWVHSRPHACGHQFHFDSDETAVYAGRSARHPLLSCVLYLTPGGDGEALPSVGGPTVVTDQTLQSDGLARVGFSFLPRLNRVVAFDSRYLHGVIPGRGVSGCGPESRRVTFMVGFWTTIQAVTREMDCPGPGQPFPGHERGAVGSNSSDIYSSPEGHSSDSQPSVCQSTNFTWPSEMGVVDTAEVKGSLQGQPAPREVAPRYIGAVWEPVARSSSTTVSAPMEAESSGADGASEADITAALRMDASKRNIQAHYKSCFQGF